MLTSLGGSRKFDDASLGSSRIKILDLGLASFKQKICDQESLRQTMLAAADTSDRKSLVTTDVVQGFRAIRAPEMFQTTESGQICYNSKTDIWALGLLVSEMVLLNPIEEWYDTRERMMS